VSNALLSHKEIEELLTASKKYLTQDEVDEVVRQFEKKDSKKIFGIFSCKKRKQAKLELIANLLQKKKKDLEEYEKIKKDVRSIKDCYYSQSHRIYNVENQIEQIKFEITRKRFYKLGIKFPLFADSKELLHLVTFIVSMAERARKNGILALESEIDNANDNLLILGLQLAVDGTDKPYSAKQNDVDNKSI
jgi:hypothetical protein